MLGWVSAGVTPLRSSACRTNASSSSSTQAASSRFLRVGCARRLPGMTEVGMRPLRALLEAHLEDVKAVVARHHGRSVAVFGSVARGDETARSDIDLLVELEPDARPFEILAIGAELEDVLGVRVDVGTPASLRDSGRHEVLAEAIPL